MKKVALVIGIIVAVVMGWSYIADNVFETFEMSFNGTEVESPVGPIVVKAFALVAVGVCAFFVAMLVFFVLSGVALIVFSIFAFVGLTLMAVAFPFLLPFLIPLFFLIVTFLVWRRQERIPMPPQKVLHSPSAK